MKIVGLQLTLILVITLLTSSVVSGRTFEVTDEDCVRIAMIASDAPRLSWAAFPAKYGYTTNPLALYNNNTRKTAFLIVFPLDQIPGDMRITSATISMHCILLSTNTPRLEVRRIIGDWSDGVCHTYRRILPEKVKWTKPGATGVGTDRARRATGLLQLGEELGEFSLNVTEDAELWYLGDVPNNGWIVTLETEGEARFRSPTHNPGYWKLSVTYEPR